MRREKPYFEYWKGEAVQKSFPTLQHSRSQTLVAQLLGGIGYDSGFEITIKLDPAYELVPDVIAAEGRITDPYPTEPFEVVVEVLSPDDSFSRILQKCHLYETLGIRQIGLADPERQSGVVVRSIGSPRGADVVARRGERVIAARRNYGRKWIVCLGHRYSNSRYRHHRSTCKYRPERIGDLSNMPRQTCLRNFDAQQGTATSAVAGTTRIPDLRMSQTAVPYQNARHQAIRESPSCAWEFQKSSFPSCGRIPQTEKPKRSNNSGSFSSRLHAAALEHTDFDNCVTLGASRRIEKLGALEWEKPMRALIHRII